MITTVVGHYPRLSARPQAPSIRRAISRFDSGQITQDDLKAVADEVTKEAIQEQVDAEMDLVTDGQVRWDDGQTYFARGIKGFVLNGLLRYFDTNTYFRQPIAQEKLEWQGPISVRDFRFAQEASPKPVKAVITGPFTLGYLSQLGCYSDRAALVLDLARILNREALALQEAGATVIQFDEPAIVAQKGDFALLREASEAVTQGVTAKTAIYTWFGDVSDIHHDFFQLSFQVFGLDFVMGRRNYDLIDAIPQDKELAAGIMNARNTRQESVDELVESIKAISRHVSLDRLHVNPSAGLEYLPRTSARDKLVRLAEGTRKAQEVLA